jgi:RNA polymerase sigma factor (sigma-70 family)
MTPTEAEQNRLIIENAGLAPVNAAIFRGQKDIPFEDLESEAMLALVRAARAWKREGQFITFAARCIRNALIDFVQHWQVVDFLDENSDENEDRVFEWQIWGHLPTEKWTKLACRPDRLYEIFEEIADKQEAIGSAMLSLKPIDRKMVWAFYMRDPPASLGEIAREYKMPYKRAGQRIARGVRKLRTIVRAIELNRRSAA